MQSDFIFLEELKLCCGELQLVTHTLIVPEHIFKGLVASV